MHHLSHNCCKLLKILLLLLYARKVTERPILPCEQRKLGCKQKLKLQKKFENKKKRKLQRRPREREKLREKLQGKHC